MENDKRLKCCIGCGRDTTSKSGLCLDCVGLGNKRSPIERGRQDDSHSPDDDEEYIRKKVDG